MLHPIRYSTSDNQSPMVKTPQCSCPRAQSLFTLLGRKWVIFILQSIDEGHHSFKTIGEAIGDANTKILTDRLEELTESGIIERRVGGDTPGAIRYYLSPLGKKLSEKLIDLSRWWGEEGR